MRFETGGTSCHQPYAFLGGAIILKSHAGDIEIAVAHHFGYRVNIVVPNVHWGLGLRHEADMIIVSSASYATEIEIKVSRGDIKADLNKWKWKRTSKLIRRFFYAVPEALKDCEYLPADKGLIIMKEWNTNINPCEIIRPSAVNKGARKLREDEIRKLLHLGCMRIWELKRRLYERQRKNGSQ